MFIVLLLCTIALGYVYRSHPGLFRLQTAGNKQLTTNNKQQAIDNKQLATGSGQQMINSGQNLQSPISKAAERVTKKPFGIYITPKTSPVQPEKFQGYHTGTDFETTTDEQNIDVPIKTICDGKLLRARFANGYGGVAVQSCTLDNNPVTIIYGHLRLSSIAAKVGDELKAGDFLANLGMGYSKETDGERKHLHLGIHKGSRITILGYVKSKEQLSNWIDPCKYVCF